MIEYIHSLMSGLLLQPHTACAWCGNTILPVLLVFTSTPSQVALGCLLGFVVAFLVESTIQSHKSGAQASLLAPAILPTS